MTRNFGMTSRDASGATAPRLSAGKYATLPANSILTTREPDISSEDREFAIVACIIGAVALLCLGLGSVYLLLSTQL